MPIRVLNDDEQPPKQVGAFEDIMRSILAGGQRGVASIPGLVGDLQTAGEAAAVWGRRKLAGDEEAEALRESQERAGRIMPTTEEVVQAVQPYSPSIGYEPQTRAGRYARTGAELGTGAALTAPLGGARTAAQVGLNALATGVVPGLASEAAGHATEGTDMEPWARGGAALLTGAVGGSVASPTSTERAVGRAMGNVTPQQLDEAERLFTEAAGMGIPLTRAQALHQVTNGATSLPDLQRVVEGTGNLRGFFAPTAEGIRTAGEGTLDTLGPGARYPSTIGPAAAEAAGEGLERANQRVNQITRPNYERVGIQPHGYMAIPPEDMAVLMEQPLYRETIGEVRRNPNISQGVADMPDASIPFNDLVQRRMGENIDQVDPTRSLSRLERTGATSQRDLVREAMDSATGGEMQTIWAEQARLRQRYLEPLMQGPLGRISRSTDTEGAINALFPQGRNQPSAGEVSQAVSRIRNSRGGEVIAPQLVRAYLESTFDQATRQLQGGSNQWGGATFNAMVRGNPQMAENLRAAITSLPNGAETWTGFERFLDVLEATGTRQRMGSATSFNNEILDQVRRGGVMSDVAKTATGTPFALPARIKEGIDQINMGRNTADVARILTEPGQAARFRRLASLPPASSEAIRLVGSLVATAQRSQNADKEYEPGQSLAAPRNPKFRLVD